MVHARALRLAVGGGEFDGRRDGRCCCDRAMAGHEVRMGGGRKPFSGISRRFLRARSARRGFSENVYALLRAGEGHGNDTAALVLSNKKELA